MRLDERFRRNVRCSPALAARQTSEAAGLSASFDPALADIDHGRWVGRTFADVAAAEPALLSAWLADPVNGTPAGETLGAVKARAGQWLDHLATTQAPACAVTHAMVIRALLSHALNIPLPATLAIDIAPLSRTLLSFNGIWRLQSLGCS